jgi:hypothetical protein
MLDCAKKTVKSHGPTGLYRGALPLIIGSSGKQAVRPGALEWDANAQIETISVELFGQRGPFVASGGCPSSVCM